MLVPAANLLIALLFYVVDPLASITVPGEPIARGAAAAPDLTISVTEDVQRVRDGQMLRYQIEVRNAGTAEAPVIVKVTVSPAAVTELQAEDAAVLANTVAWEQRVAAGQTLTFSLSGRVDHEIKAPDISVAACRYTAADAPAATCSTELHAVAANGQSAESRRLAWIASAFFGILAVAGAVWLHRKVNPPLLTPATAEQAHLPGEAPSA
jgi:uncharacterized repeat protein (TIGR01451 family)